LARLEADEYSSTGYLMAGLSFVTFAIVYLGFVDPPKQTITSEVKVIEPRRSVGAYLRDIIESIPTVLAHPEMKKIILFSGLIFATRTAVAVVETSSAHIVDTSFGWPPQTLSYLLCGMGVIGTCILIALPGICKRLGSIGEGLLLCVGVFSLALGMALMMPNNKYSFIVGLGFTWSFGSALCQTLIVTFLSRVLNPDSQGAVMGWLASLGSVSRIIGALWAGFALGSTGGTYLALGVPSAFMLPCLLGAAVLVVQTLRASKNTKL